MRTQVPISIAIILLLLGAVLGFYAPKYLHFAKVTSAVAERDTIYTPLPNDTITITEYVPEVRTIRDTVFQVMPFEAVMDTIVLRDTIQARFTFDPVSPRAYLFDFNYRPAPDSILTVTQTVFQTRYESDPWYTDVLKIGGSLAIGYGLGALSGGKR